MPFQIVHQNIAAFPCDAIVNPTDSTYSGSGGTDYAIHAAAGPELDRECATLPPLQTGEVVVTKGHSLPCKYVFHTTGPVWQGGGKGEMQALYSCYQNLLHEAVETGVTSVAFPLISSGTFGFPKNMVLRIALNAISDFLQTTDMDIAVCIPDRQSYELCNSNELSEYLQISGQYRRRVRECMGSLRSSFIEECYNICSIEDTPEISDEALSDWIARQDDSFAVMLTKLIDKKGMTDVSCYKKANVSKGTYWKILNEPNYRPSKATVLAFAIALELTLEETENLLRTVGLALSHSNLSDLIIEFYIQRGCYDIFEINAALYQHDQACLGC